LTKLNAPYMVGPAIYGDHSETPRRFNNCNQNLYFHYTDRLTET